MTIHFLPEIYTRATKTAIVLPVSGVAAMTDPSNGRVVIPARVEIDLTLVEGGPKGDRAYAYVSVIGPRLLKSGVVGKPITSIGWESGRKEGPRGYVVRPDWLTKLLADHLPVGWSPSLLDLPEVTA